MEIEELIEGYKALYIWSVQANEKLDQLTQAFFMMQRRDHDRSMLDVIKYISEHQMEHSLEEIEVISNLEYEYKKSLEDDGEV